MALEKHLAVTAKESKSLFEDAEFLYVQIMLRTVPIKAKTKPISVPLPHPIYNVDETEVCVFTKDPQKDYRRIFEEENIKAKVSAVRRSQELGTSLFC